MTNMTLALPNELYKKMARHSDLKWSEIARKAFERKLKEFEFEELIISKSKLLKKDVDAIAKKIKKEVFLELNKK